MIVVKNHLISKTNKNRLEHVFRVLTLAAFTTTYLLIVLGSTVRVTHSGMGCNGWPLCSGHFGPIDKFHPLLEQLHRYLASITTLLIVIIALVSWRSGQRGHHLRRLAFTALGIVVVQVVLGAITVITHNAPITVALHLIVAMLFLAVVTILAVRAFIGKPNKEYQIQAGGRSYLWALGSLFLVLVSGSLVVDGGAGKACPSWPACFGYHTQSGLIDLQLVHRFLVLIATVLVINFAIKAIRGNTRQPLLRRCAVAALIILTLQIFIGASVAIFKAPAVLADIHLAMAAALWSIANAMAAVSGYQL